MNIYFIRHAEAEGKTTNMSDSDRELTQKGIASMNKVVDAWKDFIPGFDIIISSPYKRAIQTAEIVKKVYETGKVISDKRLEPGSKIENIIDLAVELGNENIALVGHEPDFSLHISALISNSGATVDLKKGGIAKVSFPSRPRISGGVLEYLIPPKVFNS